MYNIPYNWFVKILNQIEFQACFIRSIIQWFVINRSLKGSQTLIFVDANQNFKIKRFQGFTLNKVFKIENIIKAILNIVVPLFFW